MLKNDRWITEQAAAGMLDPFQAGLVRHLEPDQKLRPVLSFGCSSYGYDLRLSPQELLIFKNKDGDVFSMNDIKEYVASVVDEREQVWARGREGVWKELGEREGNASGVR